MLGLLLLSNFITIILLIWLKSDAIVEWGSLIGLSKFLMADEFYKMRIDQLPLEINYPTFLKIKYYNFITKMLSCPLCLSVWLSILLCFPIAVFLNPIIILFIPTICILSLITYGIVTSLIKLV